MPNYHILILGLNGGLLVKHKKNTTRLTSDWHIMLVSFFIFFVFFYFLSMEGCAKLPPRGIRLTQEHRSRSLRSNLRVGHAYLSTLWTLLFDLLSRFVTCETPPRKGTCPTFTRLGKRVYENIAARYSLPVRLDKTLDSNIYNCAI